MQDAGVHLVTIELAFNRRPFEVTDLINPNHIQLRSDQELWHKEKMVNLAINRLPPDWKYVAWIDADVTFARSDWAEETVQRLQHYPMVQLFSQAVDLSPSYEILKQSTGIIWGHQEGIYDDRNSYTYYHPGFAWAATREGFDQLGGLFDVAILGSGDFHMARALIGMGSGPNGLSPGYKEQLNIWRKRADTFIRGNVGYVPGMILHHWHGKKVNRKYRDRWKILTKHNYDPEFDLKPDSQGLYQFTTKNSPLEQDIRRYFQARNEDSIDVE
jgi:hypothetical protein